jgi:hypothetical protein
MARQEFEESKGIANYRLHQWGQVEMSFMTSL